MDFSHGRTLAKFSGLHAAKRARGRRRRGHVLRATALGAPSGTLCRLFTSTTTDDRISPTWPKHRKALATAIRATSM